MHTDLYIACCTKEDALSQTTEHGSCSMSLHGSCSMIIESEIRFVVDLKVSIFTPTFF